MKAISKTAAVVAIGVFMAILLLARSVNAQPAANIPVLPPIEFDNCPLDVALTALTREADINFLMDPRIIQSWKRPAADGDGDQTPIENIHLSGVTPEEAMKQILREHHLILLENPQTHIDRITYPGQTVKEISTNVYKFPIKSNRRHYERQLPIQLNDVPISIALEALAHEANINFALSSRIGYGTVDKDGNVQTEPTVTCNWNNVTPAQGFFAVCENYNLVVSKDPQTGILIVGTNNQFITNYVDANLLGSDTNKFIPIQAMGSSVLQGTDCSNTNDIELEDEPLQTALKQLAGDAQINIKLDPDLPNAPMVYICLNHTSAKKAIAALCDFYGLAIIKDPTTGDIEIGPQTSP